MNQSLLAAVAVASAALLTAAPALAQTLATVNGQAIPATRADALLANASRSGQPVTPELRERVKDELIARELFLQEARKRGLDTTDDFRTQAELARDTILIQFLAADLEKKNPVTDAEIKAEYDRITAATSGKEYRARHILVEKEDEARKVIADLGRGSKFEDQARKLSKDTGSGSNGGDLDWSLPESYAPEFAQAMVKLKKGETSKAPVKSQFGFHVIRLDDIRDTQAPKLEEVKAQLQQRLRGLKLAKFEQELRATAKVD